ncbi:MAG TPA: hypothetical protein VL463_16680 [Kofleriaceae bacterium]|nr:hypothetical protein [Kofleriaceae bacterium]
MSPRQTELRFHARGGKRPGAGRKPNGPRAGVSHLRRPKLSRHHPVHVTIRVVRGVGRLRRRTAYKCVSDALLSGFPREGFRVVAASVQATHLHLLIEADDERALARGMQGFAISFARRLNRRCGRKGRVLADRYHAQAITTPRQARNAYAYVFNNWRKHREDAHRSWRIDPYSTAIAFDGWKGREDFAGFRLPRDYEVLPVHYPTVWLLTTGWKRHGRIDLFERPGHRD